MPAFRWSYVVCGLALSIASCDGETVSPDGSKSKSGGKVGCKSLVGELRSQRVAQTWPGSSSFDDHRTQLRDACDGGCGVACLEFARTSSDAEEFDGYNQKACEHGEATGCMLAEPPTPEAASKLCDSDDVLACTAAIALEFEAVPDHAPAWDRVAQAAKAGCADDDGRSCSVEAWVACAATDTCDATAIASANKAASLMPTAEILETLALAHCHAGAREEADSVLTAACTAGHTDSCARRCEALHDHPLLVREAERDRTGRILTAMALQPDVAPHWYVTLSAMDAEQLAGFEKMLNIFLPALTEAGTKAKVPPELAERFPVLVAALLRAPQVDGKKLKYWFGRLPDMTDDQRVNLLESLRNQWWVVAGEPGKSPRALVERVRLTGGGLTPGWTGRAP